MELNYQTCEGYVLSRMAQLEQENQMMEESLDTHAAELKEYKAFLHDLFDTVYGDEDPFSIVQVEKTIDSPLMYGHPYHMLCIRCKESKDEDRFARLLEFLRDKGIIQNQK